MNLLAMIPFWNITKAINRRIKGTSTRAPERIEQLLAIVEPNVPVQESKWKNIKYQLLTALCGTILQAKKDNSTLSVLVIHEFKTNETSPDNHATNLSDLEHFLSVLSGKNMVIEAFKMYGVYHFDGVDFMVGKTITKL